MLQVYRNYGWWIIGLASLGWLIYEFRKRKMDANARGTIGGLVAGVGFVAFLLGCTITVKATGSLPVIITNFGGAVDASKQTYTCTVDVDVSRLVDFADDYRLILICGMVDPSTDYLDDTRIAVSAPFHINTNSSGAGMMGIVAPLGKIADAAKSVGTPPTGLTAPPGQTFFVSFSMWHYIAIIPKDVQSDSIKKASDIKQLGGRILTEGVNASTMQIPVGPPALQTPPQPKPKKATN